MNKPELLILERAFEREIEAGTSAGIHLLQTKSKVAKKLEQQGYLHFTTITLDGRFPVSVSGYELTEFGRLIYCENCK